MRPIDLISGALLDLGARAAGETASPEDASEAFTVLNSMLGQWSNEGMMVFSKQDVVHEITPGVYRYTIGNGGSIGCSFTGSISNNVLTVTSVQSGALSVGQYINGVASGTMITAVDTAFIASQTGTYFVNIPQTVASGALTSYASRPIKIDTAFVRVNSSGGPLDYPVSVLNVENYSLIGLKELNGPWPRAVYYQPTDPVGVLNYWPNPSQGEMHLICQNEITQFATMYDTVVLPRGYDLAIRYNLALMMMPSYGVLNQAGGEIIDKLARQGKALIKRTNMAPIQIAQFDAALAVGKINDAGFIMNGGF
jgi:hypothetical protein